MPPTLSAGRVLRGLSELDGETLVGIIVTDVAGLDPEIETAADLVGIEADGAGYSRLAATARPERISGAWVLFLDDGTSTDCSDVPDRAGIVWCTDGATDGDRLHVFYDPDPGGGEAVYMRTYDDGAVSLPIESVDRRLVPDAKDGTAGQIAKVNADRSGWEFGDLPAAGAGAAGAVLVDLTGETWPITADLSAVTEAAALVLLPDASGVPVDDVVTVIPPAAETGALFSVKFSIDAGTATMADLAFTGAGLDGAYADPFGALVSSVQQATAWLRTEFFDGAASWRALWLPTGAVGAGGAVASVNGNTGTVVLDAADVGAVAAAGAVATLWLGTQAAYNALGSYSSSTVYVVTP